MSLRPSASILEIGIYMSVVIGVPTTIPSSALTFVSPDVLAHVHELWINGRHQAPTTRTFAAVFRLPELRPFAVLGLRHVTDFVRNWKFSHDDVDFLRLLPSCTSFPNGFWDYLEQLRFQGDISAVPEGTIFGSSPIEMSDDMRREYNYEGKSPFPLLVIHGPAGAVALMSEFIFNILSQATMTSMVAYERRKNHTQGAHYYGVGELHVHPIYSMIDNEADAVLNNRPLRLFEQPQNRVFVRWPHTLRRCPA
jgi:hypothetical protein